MRNPFKSSRVAAPAGANLPAQSAASEFMPELPPRSRMPSVGGHAFASPLNHIKPFVSSAWQNFTLVAPVLLVVAVVLTIMAAVQASAFITAFTQQAKSAEVNSLAPVVDKKPLIAPDYQSAANVIAKNNSAVQVALAKNRTGIVLSIKEPALLPEFMYALVTIQSYRPGVAWTANVLCLNKCEGSNAAIAEITGYTQAISFSGLRSN